MRQHPSPLTSITVTIIRKDPVQLGYGYCGGVNYILKNFQNFQYYMTSVVSKFNILVFQYSQQQIAIYRRTKGEQVILPFITILYLIIIYITYIFNYIAIYFEILYLYRAIQPNPLLFPLYYYSILFILPYLRLSSLYQIKSLYRLILNLNIIHTQAGAAQHFIHLPPLHTIQVYSPSIPRFQIYLRRVLYTSRWRLSIDLIGRLIISLQLLRIYIVSSLSRDKDTSKSLSKISFRSTYAVRKRYLATNKLLQRIYLIER